MSPEESAGEFIHRWTQRNTDGRADEGVLTADKEDKRR
jgi:hypothetical protein